MEYRFRDLLISKIDKVIGDETGNLVLTPKPQDEYLRIVGKVQGLRLAIELINETLTEYVNS